MLLIVTSSKYIAAGLPLIIGIVYAVQSFYLRTSRQMRHMDLEAKSPLYTHFQETVSGISTIRAFGWKKAFQETNLRLLDKSQRPFYLMYCIQRWLNLVLDMLVAAIAILVVTLAVQLRSNTSASSIGLALLNVLSFSSLLTTLITAFTSLETSLGAIARLRDFEKDTPQEIDGADSHIPANQWPSGGRIEFKGVSASYS
jgi:ATP-binding cassette subfamily C (CFTR/MRP) protein 1